MKTNIKLRVTPEQSEAVQKICFANNIQPWGLTDKVVRNLDQAFISISKNKILGKYNYALGDDKFYFWDKDEKEEVDADLFIRTNGTCEESINLVDNLSNSKPKEDMFKQYGFEVPDFDCTILTKVGSWLIGYTQKDSMAPVPAMWFEHTGESSGSSNLKIPNLTPIKKPWYETCKFPVLVWDIFTNKLEVATEYTNNVLYLLSDIRDFSEVRPLSNEEIDQLKQDF